MPPFVRKVFETAAGSIVKRRPVGLSHGFLDAIWADAQGEIGKGEI